MSYSICHECGSDKVPLLRAKLDEKDAAIRKLEGETERLRQFQLAESSTMHAAFEIQQQEMQREHQQLQQELEVEVRAACLRSAHEKS